jgi:hypothetical protein
MEIILAAYAARIISQKTINTGPVPSDHACMGRSRLPDDVLQKLVTLLGDKLDTISDMEDAMEELKAQLAQQGIDKKLRELAPEDGSPKKCPRCGRLVRVRTKNIKRVFEALSGKHTLVRNYHYCDHCSFGFFPRDHELGLPAEGNATLKLESRLLDFAVNAPYERGAERWCVHYPHRPFSANMLRRVAQRVGRRLELCDATILQQKLAPVPTGKRELLYVLNDGSMLPGLTGWKEAKVGVLVRGENYHAKQGGARGHVTEARYVAVWGHQEEFKQLMRAALDAERWQRFDKIVWLGDGARSNWILAETLAPTATQILDPTHAVENGTKCGRALLGEGHCLLENWQERITQLVHSGDVDALVRELMECWLSDEMKSDLSDEQLAAIDALIGYYRNNASRMDYPSYRALGLMIGSGIAEAAHRHVLQERMKLSGQHWSEHHGRRMVALRAAYQTTGAKRFHDAINRAACVTYLAAERKRRAARQSGAADVGSQPALLAA